MANQLAGLTGATFAPVTRVKVFHPEANLTTWKYIEQQFPRYYAPKPSNEAAAEIRSQAAFFKSSKEKLFAQQLLEEGRLSLDQIESAGLPEVFPGPGEHPNLRTVFNETLDFFAHPTGGALPPGVTVSSKKVAGQTLPSSVTTQSASQKGEEEGQKVLNALGGIPWLQIIEIVGGGALVIFGLTVLAQKVKGS